MALASIKTTGSNTVASVMGKLGRRPVASPSSGSARSNSGGAPTGTQRAATLLKSGPAMITVGIATRIPSPSVSPRSAWTAAIAINGPGCGGTRPCMTDNPARAGIPILSGAVRNAG